jgi:hypothetical protein
LAVDDQDLTSIAAATQHQATRDSYLSETLDETCAVRRCDQTDLSAQDSLRASCDDLVDDSPCLKPLTLASAFELVLGAPLSKSARLFATRLLTTDRTRQSQLQCDFTINIGDATITSQALDNILIKSPRDLRCIMHLMAHRRHSLTQKCLEALSNLNLNYEVGSWFHFCESSCTLLTRNKAVLSAICRSHEFPAFMDAISTASWPWSKRTSSAEEGGTRHEFHCQFGVLQHPSVSQRRHTESKKNGCEAKLVAHIAPELTLIKCDLEHSCHESDSLLRAGMSNLVRTFIDNAVQTCPNVDTICTMLARQQKQWRVTSHPEWLPLFNADARFFPRRQTIYNYVQAQSLRESFHVNDPTSVVLAARHLDSLDSTAINFLEIADKSNPRANFTWVYQSRFMQYIMAMYGNDLTCIDATYKTTKYGLPLFTLVTVDNSKQGRLMCAFVLQNEETATIANALRIIRKFNPMFNPSCVMLDKSSAEIGAIREVFTRTDLKILLCDFHRIQAMKREISKISFDQPTDKHQVLADIYIAAKVSDERLFKALKDKILKSRYYNTALKTYMDENWWPIEDMWVHCRRQFFHRGADTNNFLERSNNTIKRILRTATPGRLDMLIGIISNEVSEHFERGYLEANLESARDIRNADRQSRFGKDLCESFTRALRVGPLKESMDKSLQVDMNLIDNVADGKFTVGCSEDTLELHKFAFGRSDKYYTGHKRPTYAVDIADGSCSCPFFVTSQLPCKHFWAVLGNQRMSWANVAAHVRASSVWRPDTQISTSINAQARRLSIGYGLPQEDFDDHTQDDTLLRLADDDVRPHSSQEYNTENSRTEQLRDPDYVKQTLRDKLKTYISWTYESSDINKMNDMLLICVEQFDPMMPIFQLPNRKQKAARNFNINAVQSCRPILETTCIVVPGAKNRVSGEAVEVLEDVISPTRGPRGRRSIEPDVSDNDYSDPISAESASADLTDDSYEDSSISSNSNSSSQSLHHSPSVKKRDGITSEEIIKTTKPRGRPKTSKKNRKSYSEYSSFFCAKRQKELKTSQGEMSLTKSKRLDEN